MNSEQSMQTSPSITGEQLLEIASRQIGDESTRLHLAIFQHLNARGAKLNFSNRPWLWSIYTDDSHHIVVKKAAKTGVSEWLFVNMFDHAAKRRNGMYILPTDQVRNRLVSTRIDPIIQRVPYYRENLSANKKDVDARTLKTMFGAQWNFVGSNSAATFYEFDADVLFFDEYDKCDQQNLTLAWDRIGSAQDPYICIIGNPTIGGFGIDQKFSETDKKFWHVQCPHCNQWQVLDWWINFIREEGPGNFRLMDERSSTEGDARAFCSKCAKPIDRLSDGEWVAENLDVIGKSGYEVSRLFGAPGTDGNVPRHIIREEFEFFTTAQSNESNLQTFYNNRLGITYKSPGNSFSRELLGSCAGNYKMPLGAPYTTAGIDVGGVLHLHIEIKDGAGVRHKVFIGTCGWDDLEEYWQRYHINYAVIDGGPETYKVQELCRRHPGVYACYYNLSDEHAEPFVVDDPGQVIKAKRTASLDASLNEYQSKLVKLPTDWESLDNGDFVKQMCAATRKQILDAKGRPRMVWDEGSAADHHQHADNYARLAARVNSGPLVTAI